MATVTLCLRLSRGTLISFLDVEISLNFSSIHSKRVPVESVRSGLSASFALKRIKRAQIRRGMVLVQGAPDHPHPECTWEFEAQVVILYHSTTIMPGYQPVIQCMNIRQTAKIVKILDRYTCFVLFLHI